MWLVFCIKPNHISEYDKPNKRDDYIMATIEIRQVDTFPEEFSTLESLMFKDIQLYSSELAEALRIEAEHRQNSGMDSTKNLEQPLIRFAAYDGDAIIGWAFGYFEYRGRVFHMSNSAVLPQYRRQGIYSRLLTAVLDYTYSQAVIMVTSYHSILNNPIIINKLKAGFQITGLSHSARMGALVQLTYHHSKERQAIFRQRLMPLSENP